MHSHWSHRLSSFFLILYSFFFVISKVLSSKSLFFSSIYSTLLQMFSLHALSHSIIIQLQNFCFIFYGFYLFSKELPDITELSFWVFWKLIEYLQNSYFELFISQLAIFCCLELDCVVLDIFWWWHIFLIFLFLFFFVFCIAAFTFEIADASLNLYCLPSDRLVGVALSEVS